MPTAILAKQCNNSYNLATYVSLTTFIRSHFHDPYSFHNHLITYIHKVTQSIISFLCFLKQLGSHKKFTNNSDNSITTSYRISYNTCVCSIITCSNSINGVVSTEHCTSTSIIYCSDTSGL